MRTILKFNQQQKLKKKWSNVLFWPINMVFARTIAADLVPVRPLSPPNYSITMDPAIYGNSAGFPNPRPFLDTWYNNLWVELKPTENLIVWEQKNIFNTNGIKS